MGRVSLGHTKERRPNSTSTSENEWEIIASLYGSVSLSFEKEVKIGLSPYSEGWYDPLIVWVRTKFVLKFSHVIMF